MQLENIRYVNFDEPDRRLVQERAIEAATADPEKFLLAYRDDARSFDGRYVAADLFKETFAEFSASRESRNRYNNPVHNSAAVLSSALFAQNLQGKRESGRDTVYFLTGSPGAGKTSMVLKENSLPRDAHMVFEGQMSTFATSVDKIQQAIDAGFRAHIIVVHARSENALDNTLRRFYEEGRGSSIATIAKIQGGLPQSLEQLGAYFGDNVLLDIVDVRDRSKPVNLQGFENINVLKSEGTYEHIEQRLHARIEQLRESGRINDDAYRQAAGLPPRDRLAVDQQRHGRDQGDARERGIPSGSGQAPVLGHDHAKEGDAGRQTQSGLRITDSSKVSSNVTGKVVEVTDTHVLVQTGRTDAVRFAKADLSRDVSKGQRIELEFKANERKQVNEQTKQTTEQTRQREVSQQNTRKRGLDGL
ncbi:KfrB domain-containing protein [Paraburkholderia dioscoreae]|uniref:Zeta toxin n=1 Tax=Paraburkholderia dioscoreae TaxID=2604047 RepID=A0A5Q4ZGP1_9BURK|nr:zeta toxin family protein [Paraburkholderia dioscoreae]VVD30921.1 Zeta toxin [Paraburkholderia dioscoreae]